MALFGGAKEIPEFLAFGAGQAVCSREQALSNPLF